MFPKSVLESVHYFSALRARNRYTLAKEERGYTALLISLQGRRPDTNLGKLLNQGVHNKLLSTDVGRSGRLCTDVGLSGRLLADVDLSLLFWAMLLQCKTPLCAQEWDLE